MVAGVVASHRKAAHQGRFCNLNTIIYIIINITRLDHLTVVSQEVVAAVVRVLDPGLRVLAPGLGLVPHTAHALAQRQAGARAPARHVADDRGQRKVLTHVHGPEAVLHIANTVVTKIPDRTLLIYKLTISVQTPKAKAAVKAEAAVIAVADTRPDRAPSRAHRVRDAHPAAEADLLILVREATLAYPRRSSVVRAHRMPRNVKVTARAIAI